MELSRRDFIKLGAVVGSGVILTLANTVNIAAEVKDSGPAVEKAMLYDSTKCVGCRACQTACKRWNNLSAEPVGFNNIYDNPNDLSFNTWTIIKARQTYIGAKEDLLLCKYQCMHCTDAACVKVCPTHALTHNKMGFVQYDSNICTGCNYCAQFCPFHVPRMGGDNLTGLQKMGKCTFCQDRVPEGRKTACVEACPAGALQYGDRSSILEVAKKRISEIKGNYPNAVLYGENELGGLHVLYIFKTTPQVYSYPEQPSVSSIAIAWKDAIQPLGLVAGGLAILGLGFNYIVAKKSASTKERVEQKEE